MKLNIWQELYDFSFSPNLFPGEIFETSLLGKVSYRKDEQNNYEGVIPSELQLEAIKHGLIIEMADYQRGTYLLKRIDPNAKLKEKK